MSLPRGASDALERYEDLLRTYALSRGMVAATDSAQLRERHLADSLRAVPLLGSPQRILDMGSGAGLPGVPIAIAVPGAHVVLAEPRRSRVAFLELVVDELHLENTTVHAGRVEDLAPGYDVTLARGFAGPVATWGAARRLLRGTGRLFYWAGASFDPARDCPQDALVDVHRRADLESAGPIVIMARQ